jgi:hypothetical protein
MIGFLYCRNVSETPARFVIDNVLNIGDREVAETLTHSKDHERGVGKVKCTK